MPSQSSSAPPENSYPEQSFQAQAYAGFVRALKGVWREGMYRNVVAEARAAGANSVQALETAMADSSQYALYAWTERYSQQMSLHGRWGGFREFGPQLSRLSAQLDAATNIHPERLNLDPNLQLPPYLTEQETHQYPGGLWQSDIGGYVLEAHTKTASFSLVAPERPLIWYAEYVRDNFAPARILDLGCARARGTRELKRAMPDAEIHAVDLCAPILRLAHLRNLEDELDITLWQRNAKDTGFDAHSFDLVTSHWLIHEMPPSAIRNMMREGMRLLRPGGTFAMYDMYISPGGVIGDWLHAGYAARNNEPFAWPVAQMDLESELAAAGFARTRIELSRLQATSAALADELPQNRTHYMTVITATKST